MSTREQTIDGDPLWYKDAVIYQLHIRSFSDSDDDGIGDFKGLLSKLDYLEGLGVTALWLLPFYPSPLRDDGYDIADYFSVNPDYGTLKDCREFLRAAHRRGIRVITELVLNHTSNEHEWFQKSRHAKPGSKLRDLYVWSDSPDKYADARIIFQDFESSNWSFDSVAQAYYWHRFYSHQPDLNFDNPRVQKSMFKAIDFWMNMGVDGLRLDAVPYLFEREGTNCENLPQTHEYLRQLRSHVDENFKDRMLLAEANQWPEDAAAYFGRGDECHMAFHFPVMPRMFMAIHMEDSFPITDILKSTPDIPDPCQWAMFLRNHDELTLEMVTDEERDYMYRVYARDPLTKINVGIRRRLAPLLGNSRRKIELLNVLLFSLPGTPVIYYGDELGMGDNYFLGDRNGVRTPMQWSPDRNAGFSKANPQKLFLPVIIDPEYHYESVNVENQERNPSSLLWFMKRVIAMRKKFSCMSRGTFELVPSNNSRILSFARTDDNETVVVVANLSRFAQVCYLDLGEFEGIVPREVFSQNRFPQVRREPYVLTLGPHSHYWLLMKEQRRIEVETETETAPPFNVKSTWLNVFKGRSRQKLEDTVLPRYLTGVRWFGAKSSTIREVRIEDDAPVSSNGPQTTAVLLQVCVDYTDKEAELYLLPISYATGADASRIQERFRKSVVTKLRVDDQEGILYDSAYDEAFRSTLLSVMAHRRKISGSSGRYLTHSHYSLKRSVENEEEPLTSRVMGAEQSNTSIVYGNKYILKLYRRLDEGINPDYEISRYLSEQMGFVNTPRLYGAVEYGTAKLGTTTVGLLQQFIETEGDAWSYSTQVVSRYFEHILARPAENRTPPEEYPSMLDMDPSLIPVEVQELIGTLYLEMASLLGKRTGQLHLVLGAATGLPAFHPEPFSLLYQRSLYQSLQSLVRRNLALLSRKSSKLPKEIQDLAENVCSSDQKIISRMQRLLKSKIAATRIRIHGDYHLGQILYTGKDFVIIDFEGEPARPIGERRLKYSALKDVAGMIRSFHYVAYSTLLSHVSVRPEDIPVLEPWIDPWFRYVSGVFLRSYLDTVGDVPFIPNDRDGLETLLQTFILEKAIYELGYELNNRPDWVSIPLRGIQYVLKGAL